MRMMTMARAVEVTKIHRLTTTQMPSLGFRARLRTRQRRVYRISVTAHCKRACAKAHTTDAPSCRVVALMMSSSSACYRRSIWQAMEHRTQVRSKMVMRPKCSMID